ncbi:MAG: thioether cross-link-forming SCIFF peptide maturase [Bacillota bacterium]
MINLQNYNFSANIHLFRIKARNILLDVNSGAVHVLDNQAFEYIQELVRTRGDWDQAQRRLEASYPPESVKEIRNEIEEAYQAKSLFTEEAELDLNYGSFYPKSICLNVAHLCNMRCRYCFAQQGSFGQAQDIMTLEVARQAVEFLISSSGPRRNLELDFFGGEPLLNMQVVKATVDFGRDKAEQAGKQINYTLTTNALGLDEQVRNYLVSEGIAVILSLDGRPQVNDRMRILPNGEGTYQKITPQIQDMVALQPASYYIRGTFTAQNLDFTEDFLHLVNLGFENISLEPVTGGKPGIALTEEHLPQIAAQYEALADIILEHEQQAKPINFFHFNLDLTRGPCLAKRTTGCGAGIEYLAVTPEGDIFPCHQFIGIPEFKMGNVRERELDNSVRQRFAGNTIANKECRYCWARFYCGGGCHALAYFQNGDLSVPYRLACLMHKKRLECSFYMAARRMEG